MARPRILTDEERREKKKLANFRYRNSEEGKAITLEGIKRHKQTDKYYETCRKYYDAKKQAQAQAQAQANA